MLGTLRYRFPRPRVSERLGFWKDIILVFRYTLIMLFIVLSSNKENGYVTIKELT